MPLLSRMPVPRVWPPAVNITVPVGTGDPARPAATTAVKVTGWPATAWPSEDVSVVVVAPAAIVSVSELAVAAR